MEYLASYGKARVASSRQRGDNVRFQFFDTSIDYKGLAVNARAGIYVGTTAIKKAMHVPGGTEANYGLDASGNQMKMNAFERNRMENEINKREIEAKKSVVNEFRKNF